MGFLRELFSRKLEMRKRGVEPIVEGVHPLIFLVGIRDTHVQGLVHRLFFKS